MALGLKLYLPFEFVASHSLSGFEKPHPHLWKFELEVTGPPVNGKIVDLYKLGELVQVELKSFEGTYLNENPRLPQVARDFPTCESLAQAFYGFFEKQWLQIFRGENPELRILSVKTSLLDVETKNVWGSARFGSLTSF